MSEETARELIAALSRLSDALAPQPGKAENDALLIDKLGEEKRNRDRLARNPFAKIFLSRMGLLILAIGAVVSLHVWDWWSSVPGMPFGLPGAGTATFYLDNAAWVIPLFCVLAVACGLTSYNSFAPLHHNHHGGAVALIWIFGVGLLSLIAYLLTLFGVGAQCIDPFAIDARHVLPDLRGLPPTADCHQAYFRLYTVLSPWQAGIGAGLGLLGVAWSTLYRSVYEDWKEHETLSSAEFILATQKAEQIKKAERSRKRTKRTEQGGAGAS